MFVQAAKQLADAVIPNEYGIEPAGKMRIGSNICTFLLGKVLADLGNMRDESIATAVSSIYEKLHCCCKAWPIWAGKPSVAQQPCWPTCSYVLACCNGCAQMLWY